jgi:MFS family permease
VLPAIVVEVFQGKHYGTIFGTLMLAAILGGALGPWITGALYDTYGSYCIAFWIGGVASLVSTAAIWLAAPRKVRAVVGRQPRVAVSG